jgi:hypothetical protein
MPDPPKRTLKISIVSHPLDSQVAERRYCFALRVFFESGDDPDWARGSVKRALPFAARVE